MAGELKLNNVSVATESGGDVTLGNNIISNNTASFSETLGIKKTGAISSGSNSLTVDSNSGIAVGDIVRALGVPTGTTVTNISGTTITLSANATRTISNFATGFFKNKLLGQESSSGLCKAWVNFNGVGTSNNQIRGSLNVSSVTDVATARYQVNFETNLPHVNYVVAGSNLGSGENNYYAFVGSDSSLNTVDHFSFYSIHNSGAVAEMGHLQLLVIG
tara:strand:+ start:524 stop:1177 length:654 start_codon:yes stop_codon:yes gene_type:complete